MGKLPLPPSNAELAAIRETAQRNAAPPVHNKLPESLTDEQLRKVREESARLGRPLTPEEYELIVWGKVQPKMRYGIKCV
jgi:hypothetical protein